MSALTYLIGAPLVLGILSAALVWHAWVLSVLWGWFVVPMGAPALGVAHAAGVVMVVAALAWRGKHEQRKDPEDKRSGPRKFGDVLAHMAIRPAVLLAVGWVAKGFM